MMRTLLCVYQVSKHIGYKTFTKMFCLVKSVHCGYFAVFIKKNITYGVWMHEYVLVLLVVMMAVMYHNALPSMILAPSKYLSHLFFLWVIEDIPRFIIEIQFRLEENCNQKNVYTYVILLRIFPRRMLNFVNLEVLHRSALKTFYVEHLFTSCVTNLSNVTLDMLLWRNIEEK